MARYKLHRLEEANEWFWPQIDQSDPDGCWPWTGRLGTSGYGSVSVGGKYYGAHRLAWLLTHGDPGDAWVLHDCDNPPCCHPEPGHLHLGDRAMNMAEASQRGRIVTVYDNWTTCSHGHEFNETNTRVNSKGHRQCRVCDAEEAREKRRDPERGKRINDLRRQRYREDPDYAERKRQDARRWRANNMNESK